MQPRRTTPTPDRRCSLTLAGGPEVNSTVRQHLASPLAKRSCNGMRRSRLLYLDLICSILVKLPVKSILRFRSVCKSWKELISDPIFIKLHSSGKPPRILVITHPISDPTLTLSENDTISLYALHHEDGGSPNLLFQLPCNDSTTIVTPYDCNGLVLIHSKEDICVCNPSTRETIHLSGFSRGSYERRVQYIGFGLDPSTNLYKVVRFFYHKFKDDDDYDGHLQFQARCEVFTLGTEFQSWRQVDDPPYGAIPISDSASANGRIYWRTLSTDCILLSFDLRHEDFRVLLPPSTAKKWEYFIMNGGGQGVERLWYVKINWLTITYDIWELTDETTHSWTIIHIIGFKMSTTLAMPKLVIGDGRLILLSNQEKLQQYDIVSKERKTILTMGGVTLLLPSLYRETLVSFKP